MQSVKAEKHRRVEIASRPRDIISQSKFRRDYDHDIHVIFPTGIIQIVPYVELRFATHHAPCTKNWSFKWPSDVTTKFWDSPIGDRDYSNSPIRRITIKTTCPCYWYRAYSATKWYWGSLGRVDRHLGITIRTSCLTVRITRMGLGIIQNATGSVHRDTRVVVIPHGD